MGASAIARNARYRSGIRLPLQDVLDKIANKFAGMNDGLNKTAIAMAILGRGGAEMIPVLDRGAVARNGNNRSGRKDKADTFAQDTAKRTGRTTTGVHEDVRRAAELGVETLDKVSGTSLDTDHELRAAALRWRRPPRTQRKGVLNRHSKRAAK